ncbi:MAG TPA: MFS transporter [Ktedonobacterales bacterium]|nr:MFS transporter [Ktedonobacterales bacterium]
MSAAIHQPRASTFRALRSSRFAWVWSGQTISRLGDGAYMTALAWAALQITGSATAVGALLIASAIPGLVFILIGGVAADRYSRRRIMLLSDAGRALTLAIIAALGMAHILQLWHLMVMAVIFGFVRGFFTPAYQAVIPELVEEEALASANGLTGISQTIGGLIGPSLAAGLITVSSANAAFAFDAASFVVAALCVLPAGALDSPAAPAPVEADSAETSGQPPRPRGLRGVLAESRDGLTYILGSGWLISTIVLPLFANPLLVASSPVALPKLIQAVWRQGAWLYGLDGSVFAVGSLLGLLVFSRVRPKRRGVACFVMGAIAGVAMLGFALPVTRPLEPALVAGVALVTGFTLNSFNLIWLTTVQELAPRDKLGRVFSIDALGSLALIPVGYAVAGVLSDQFSPIWVFVIAGALEITTSLIGLSIRAVRDLR